MYNKHIIWEIMNSHIYSYTDKKKNKIIYVGKTNGRNKTYKTGSKILKRYISIFGYDVFDSRFDRNIIEECSIDKLNDREEYWIKYYNTQYNGVNITKGGRFDWNRNNYKEVIQYDLDGKFIREWEYGKIACIELGFKNYDGISACCIGKQNTGGGFIWRFKTNNYLLEVEPPKRKKYKEGTSRVKYQSIEIDNKTYNSITQAAKDLGWSFGKLNYKIKNNLIKYKWLKK